MTATVFDAYEGDGSEQLPVPDRHSTRDRRTQHERVRALEDLIIGHVRDGLTLSQAHVLIVDSMSEGSAWELRDGIWDLRLAMRRAKLSAPDRASLWSFPKVIEAEESTLEQQRLQVRSFWIGLMYGGSFASASFILTLIGW